MTPSEREKQDIQHLLYFASHDLAEPIRTARVLLDLACQTDDLEQSREFCSKAQTALAKGQRLVAALNEYRKLSNLGTNGPVDLYEALMEAKNGLAAFSTRRGTLKVEGTLPTVRASRFAMVTIFRNLLSNAVKYTRHDSLPYITVSAERSRGYWIVSVADHGLGFEPKHAESIFKLGERIHPGVEGSWGDGIGLANCRAAVASQGGRIWAESDGPNLGAAFHFTVPEAADDSSR